jgi:hypothetical protein
LHEFNVIGIAPSPGEASSTVVSATPGRTEEGVVANAVRPERSNESGEKFRH